MRILLFLVSAFGGVFGFDTGKVKVMSVMEGDSVTLNTCVNDIQKENNVLWTYGPENNVLAKMNKGSQIPIDEDDIVEMFRDRLKLDPQTGSLSIKNIRTGHSGLYTASITNSTRTSTRVFNVNVTGVFDPEANKLTSVSTNEGQSVTLNTGVTVERDDLVVWKFGQSTKHCDYDAGYSVPHIAKLDGETQQTSVDAGEDHIFSGCLSLNEQTGDLTIINAKTKYAGCYFLQITSNTRTRFRRFYVTVNDPAPRTHWEITGPVFLAAGAVLGLIGMILAKDKCKNTPETGSPPEDLHLTS